MKKFSIFKKMAAAVGAMALAVCAAFGGNDKIISFEELPASARALVQEHFMDRQIATVKMDAEVFEKEYKIVFTNGDEIEFGGNGFWEEIDCKASSVPAAVVPAKIQEFLAQNYPEIAVKKIERDAREIEVDLSNGVELKFDLSFRLKKVEQ